MPSPPRLKRKVLRQAVAENMESLDAGRRLRRQRRRARLGRLRSVALVVVPLVLLAASSYVLSRAIAAPSEAVVITQVFEPVYDPESPLEVIEELAEPTPTEALKAREAFPSFGGPGEDDELRRPAPVAVQPAVLSLPVRRIVLDPGHGGSNEGTVAPGGLQEKALTLDIAFRTRRLLEDAGFEVLMTREEDRDVALAERTAFANHQRADIFLSIHVNWIEARKVRGVETYYLGATDDPYLTQLAAKENAESGYSLADYRDILDGVYAGVRQDESRRLAGSVQRQLLASLLDVNPSLQDRGVKTAPFVVLVSTEMPAVLVEVSCLSNRDEAALLAKPFYRQYIAEALAAGVGTYAESLGGPEAVRLADTRSPAG